MADRQLRLFAHSKPLLERMGPEFFRAAPRGPGVYVMTGSGGEILYVGQSGNLHARINCYKNGNPDSVPRRIVRLIHSVTSITWEECASTELARVRENELLRLHRPKFNRINTYPQAHGFIGVVACGGKLTLLRLRDEHGGAIAGERGHRRNVERPLPPHPDPLPQGEGDLSGGSVNIYGAFKGGAVYAFGSLLRLLWSVSYKPGSPFDLPRPLLAARPPVRFTMETDGAKLVEQLHDYFSGESEELVEALAMQSMSETLSLFHKNFIRADLEVLTLFFQTGPRRIWRLRREHGIEDGLVGKEELDDLTAFTRTRSQARDVKRYELSDREGSH